MRRPQNLKKISHLSWQNSCFYSVATKQVGDIFSNFCGLYRKAELYRKKFPKFVATNATQCQEAFQMPRRKIRVLAHNVSLQLKSQRLAKSLHNLIFGLLIWNKSLIGCNTK